MIGHLSFAQVNLARPLGASRGDNFQVSKTHSVGEVERVIQKIDRAVAVASTRTSN